jgi:hypothetical protein
MKDDDQAFAQWVSRLHTEWLPHWRDMPDTTFVWWNLLVTALEGAVDERD